MVKDKVDPRAPVESEWKGEPKWSCPLCEFDSMESWQAVADHIIFRHPIPVSPVNPIVPPEEEVKPEETEEKVKEEDISTKEKDKKG